MTDRRHRALNPKKPTSTTIRRITNVWVRQTFVLDPGFRGRALNDGDVQPVSDLLGEKNQSPSSILNVAARSGANSGIAFGNAQYRGTKAGEAGWCLPQKKRSGRHHLDSAMWPFKKKTKAASQTMPPGQISYSQLDITESFGDNLSLGTEDWIATVPLNKMTTSGRADGLPPLEASDDEVYEFGSRLSLLRESISVPNDGVYCPICHLANIQLSRLRTPCPKCGRPLLKFGWD